MSYTFFINDEPFSGVEYIKTYCFLCFDTNIQKILVLRHNICKLLVIFCILVEKNKNSGSKETITSTTATQRNFRTHSEQNKEKTEPIHSSTTTATPVTTPKPKQTSSRFTYKIVSNPSTAPPSAPHDKKQQGQAF